MEREWACYHKCSQHASNHVGESCCGEDGARADSFILLPCEDGLCRRGEVLVGRGFVGAWERGGALETGVGCARRLAGYNSLPTWRPAAGVLLLPGHPMGKDVLPVQLPRGEKADA